MGCVRGRGCVAGVRRVVGGCATLLLSVTGVTHALWNKQVTTGRYACMARSVHSRGFDLLFARAYDWR